MPGLGYGALTINLAGQPPLAKDPRVRQAFQLALDRAALSQVVFAGMYEPDAQAISAASPYYAPGVPMPPHDVAAARALLQQAGMKAPVRVDLLVYNTPQGTQAGEVIQAMANEAGFDVHVVAAEFGAVIAATIRGEYDVTLGGWSGLLDPDSNAYAFLHTGSALNIAKYSNPDADRLLEQARAESDMGKRRALYEQLWRQVQTGPAADLSLDDAQHPGRIAEGGGRDAAGEWVAAAAGCSAGGAGRRGRCPRPAGASGPGPRLHCRGDG